MLRIRLLPTINCLLASTLAADTSTDTFAALEKQNAAVYSQLLHIAGTDDFSKIKMDLPGICPRKIEQCGALTCAVKQFSFKGADGVIDLLYTVESHSKDAHRTGPDVWKDLYFHTANDEQLQKIVSGLQFSVSTHIAAFYTPVHMPMFGGRFISNPYRFQSRYRKQFEDNFAFYYSLLRTAVASLINNPGEVDGAVTDLSQSIINYNTRKMDAECAFNASCPKTMTFIGPNASQHINADGIFIEPSAIVSINKMIRALACLNCQKCRLWGTIQLKGLRAAVKSLNNIPVTKMDVICLVNAFRRASVSVVESRRLQRMRMPVLRLALIYHYEISVGLISLLVISILFHRTRKYRVI